jgi:hypothetical protein
LKCLVLKEIFQLQRARFLLGDFLPYLRATEESFDIGFACGVLYHLLDPVELIELLSRRCRSVFLWTHYYDPRHAAEHPEMGAQFEPEVPRRVTGGFSHTPHRRRYPAQVFEWKGFCGGGAPEACWLERGDITGALRHFGFRILGEVPEDNPNGPALLLAATRE